MDHNRTPISAHTYIHIKALLIESGGGPPSLVHSWPIYPTPTRRISLGVSSTKPSSSSSSRQTLFSIRQGNPACIIIEIEFFSPTLVMSVYSFFWDHKCLSLLTDKVTELRRTTVDNFFGSFGFHSFSFLDKSELSRMGEGATTMATMGIQFC